MTQPTSDSPAKRHGEAPRIWPRLREQEHVLPEEVLLQQKVQIVEVERVAHVERRRAAVRAREVGEPRGRGRRGDVARDLAERELAERGRGGGEGLRDAMEAAVGRHGCLLEGCEEAAPQSTDASTGGMFRSRVGARHILDGAPGNHALTPVLSFRFRKDQLVPGRASSMSHERVDLSSLSNAVTIVEEEETESYLAFRAALSDELARTRNIHVAECKMRQEVSCRTSPADLQRYLSDAVVTYQMLRPPKVG